MGSTTHEHTEMDPVPEAPKSKSDYVPRKCCITNALLTSKDHASVQINVGHVDHNGIYKRDEYHLLLVWNYPPPRRGRCWSQPPLRAGWVHELPCSQVEREHKILAHRQLMSVKGQQVDTDVAVLRLLHV